MRIFSKFHDYYDNVVGFSPEPIWERKTKHIDLDPTKKTDYSQHTIIKLLTMWENRPRCQFFGNSTIDHDMFILGFCGKIMAFYPEELRAVNNNYFVTYEKFLRRTPSEVKSWDHTRKYFKNTFNDKNHKQFEEKYTHLVTTEDFIDLKSPIFMLRRKKLIVNPCLKDFDIQKFIDPYTAYQEIDMYLSNQFVGNFEPMPEFSDELKRDTHGMDEWSFKQKGPKKRKRK